jgi:hypothetical protein
MQLSITYYRYKNNKMAAAQNSNVSSVVAVDTQ